MNHYGGPIGGNPYLFFTSFQSSQFSPSPAWSVPFCWKIKAPPWGSRMSRVSWTRSYWLCGGGELCSWREYTSERKYDIFAPSHILTNVCTKSYLLEYLHPVIFSQIFAPGHNCLTICIWSYFPKYLHLVVFLECLHMAIFSKIFEPSHVFPNICTWSYLPDRKSLVAPPLKESAGDK